MISDLAKNLTYNTRIMSYKRVKPDFIKIQSFCDSKDTIKKVMKQPEKWEKIFFNA